MDRLRCLQIFAEVARDGSFTGAARRLGMSKASVTKHVAWLEGTLRAPLLHRSTKHVALTDAGRAALDSAKLLLERYEHLEAEARDSVRHPKGLVRVGTPPSFGVHHLTPLVLGFTAKNPDIQVLLSLDDGSANLIEQGLDLSIRIAPALRDSTYVAQPLTRAPQVLVASPRYLEREGAPLVPADLARHNCLLHTLKSPTSIWRFSGPQGEVSARVRGTLCANFGEPLQKAAVSGHGISMHPYYMVADDLAAGRLEPVLPQYEPLELDIFVVFSSRENLPVRVALGGANEMRSEAQRAFGIDAEALA
jgi:DNA-binding transcriptional LysR family regulator